MGCNSNVVVSIGPDITVNSSLKRKTVTREMY